MNSETQTTNHGEKMTNVEKKSLTSFWAKLENVKPLLKEALKGFDSEKVQVGDNRVLVTFASNGDKKEMLRLKKEIGEHLMATFPNEKFIHIKHKGAKVWRTNEWKSFRCGIEWKCE